MSCCTGSKCLQAVWFSQISKSEVDIPYRYNVELKELSDYPPRIVLDLEPHSRTSPPAVLNVSGLKDPECFFSVHILGTYVITNLETTSSVENRGVAALHFPCYDSQFHHTWLPVVGSDEHEPLLRAYRRQVVKTTPYGPLIRSPPCMNSHLLLNKPSSIWL